MNNAILGLLGGKKGFDKGSKRVHRLLIMSYRSEVSFAVRRLESSLRRVEDIPDLEPRRISLAAWCDVYEIVSSMAIASVVVVASLVVLLADASASEKFRVSDPSDLSLHI